MQTSCKGDGKQDMSESVTGAGMKRRINMTGGDVYELEVGVVEQEFPKRSHG